jgi:hypothetical protein
MHRGYIKLWRKSFDSGLHRDHKTWALWTYILCQATYKEIDININGEIVHLIPGQMITGRKKLAKELHMSERGIRTRLNHLKNYGNLTIKTTNRFSIINVINWNVYQQDESQNDQPNDQQATSKRPASDHKQEVKKVKKERIPPYIPPGGVELKNNGDGWINIESWNDFLDHRKSIKKPLTEKAVKISLNFLKKNQSAQKEIIDNTIMNRWTGLFPAGKNKDKSEDQISQGSKMAYERLKKFQEQL